MINKILLTFVCLSVILGTKASTTISAIGDSAQISLLTSYPWQKQVYAIDGHTALRVNDFQNGRDFVFNYGVFSFDTPNFLYKFVKGETDYIVAPIPFQYYFEEYQTRGERLVEQRLNLSSEERMQLWYALVTNCAPENRTYRYNFFFDNCATRVRNIVEDNTHGKIVYISTNKTLTFRDLLDECTQYQPWYRFGIALVLGGHTDKEATDREKMFLPLYMMDAYKGAIINDSANVRDLVSTETILINGNDKAQTVPMNYPLIVGSFILLLSFIINALAIKNGKVNINKLVSFILFVIAGITGCVVFFLMFFSVHPATNPNWNLVWLNPLQLIFALFFFFKFASKAVYYYHFINFASLILFLLAWFLIPQHLETSFIPYILSLLICSGTYVWLTKSMNKTKDIVK